MVRINQTKNTKINENEIGKIIVDTAAALHREPGPGLLETVYEVIPVYELVRGGLSVKRQISVLNRIS